MSLIYGHIILVVLLFSVHHHHANADKTHLPVNGNRLILSHCCTDGMQQALTGSKCPAVHRDARFMDHDIHETKTCKQAISICCALYSHLNSTNHHPTDSISLHKVVERLYNLHSSSDNSSSPASPITTTLPKFIDEQSSTKGCNDGYERDHVTKQCIDIDECSRNTHKCTQQQRCENTNGGFYCVNTLTTSSPLKVSIGLQDGDESEITGTERENEVTESPELSVTSLPINLPDIESTSEVQATTIDPTIQSTESSVLPSTKSSIIDQLSHDQHLVNTSLIKEKRDDVNEGFSSTSVSTEVGGDTKTELPDVKDPSNVITATENSEPTATNSPVSEAATESSDVKDPSNAITATEKSEPTATNSPVSEAAIELSDVKDPSDVITATETFEPMATNSPATEAATELPDVKDPSNVITATEKSEPTATNSPVSEAATELSDVKDPSDVITATETFEPMATNSPVNEAATELSDVKDPSDVITATETFEPMATNSPATEAATELPDVKDPSNVITPTGTSKPSINNAPSSETTTALPETEAPSVDTTTQASEPAATNSPVSEAATELPDVKSLDPSNVITPTGTSEPSTNNAPITETATELLETEAPSVDMTKQESEPATTDSTVIESSTEKVSSKINPLIKNQDSVDTSLDETKRADEHKVSPSKPITPIKGGDSTTINPHSKDSITVIEATTADTLKETSVSPSTSGPAMENSSNSPKLNATDNEISSTAAPTTIRTYVLNEKYETTTPATMTTTTTALPEISTIPPKVIGRPKTFKIRNTTTHHIVNVYVKTSPPRLPSNTRIAVNVVVEGMPVAHYTSSSNELEGRQAHQNSSACEIGYEWDDVTEMCVDIDECLVKDICDSTWNHCENVPGSHKCIRNLECSPGYTIVKLEGNNLNSLDTYMCVKMICDPDYTLVLMTENVDGNSYKCAKLS